MPPRLLCIVEAFLHGGQFLLDWCIPLGLYLEVYVVMKVANVYINYTPRHKIKIHLIEYLLHI